MKLERFLRYFTARVSSTVETQVKFTVHGKPMVLTNLTFDVTNNTWVIELQEPADD